MLEEEKVSLFPQEVYMRAQLERQVRPLQQQRALLTENLKFESHLLNKIIISDTYGNHTSSYDSWEMAAFYAGSSENPTEIRGSFMPLAFELSPHGLQLRSNILRSTKTIRLSSLACELKISFRLVGDSTFWIMTRSSGVRDPDAVICKIKKEQDNQRVFLIFGANIGNNNEFKFFKKQEFPEMFQSGEELIQDFVDMKIRFVDNGDDRVFVKARLGKDKVIEMGCDKYIPCFRDTHIMLAGSGDSVLLKNFSARQVGRVQGKPNLTRYECCRLF